MSLTDGRKKLWKNPNACVELIEPVHQGRIVEAQIAEPLTYVGPVLLFDMGVVVLFVGTGSGELDRMRSILEVSNQVPLEELGSVIAM